MTIGDGENDIKRLKLALLCVALRNACVEAKVAADVIGDGNDNDSVALAIRQYAF